MNADGETKLDECARDCACDFIDVHVYHCWPSHGFVWKCWAVPFYAVRYGCSNVICEQGNAGGGNNEGVDEQKATLDRRTLMRTVQTDAQNECQPSKDWFQAPSKVHGDLASTELNPLGCARIDGNPIGVNSVSMATLERKWGWNGLLSPWLVDWNFSVPLCKWGGRCRTRNDDQLVK